MTKLGSLIPVPIRDVWPSEDEDFTPWVASESGLTLLGDSLGLVLESAEREVEIGQFRADIVCDQLNDDGSKTKVIIENQLGISDHEHLGQLTTYAASSGAGIGIWVAGGFTPEHRQAIKALNDSSAGQPRFFCVEVGAWRIGDSDPAPAFSVLVKPADRGYIAVHAPPRENRGHLQRFWMQLDQRLSEERMVQSHTLRWRYYQRFDLPHDIACLSVVREHHQNRVRLYMRGDGHVQLYSQLKSHRSAINDQLGESVSWKSDHKRSSIDVSTESFLYDQRMWKGEIDWMVANLKLFRRVFEPMLAELAGDEDIPEGYAA